MWLFIAVNANAETVYFYKSLKCRVQVLNKINLLWLLPLYWKLKIDLVDMHGIRQCCIVHY